MESETVVSSAENTPDTQMEDQPPSKDLSQSTSEADLTSNVDKTVPKKKLSGAQKKRLAKMRRMADGTWKPNFSHVNKTFPKSAANPKMKVMQTLVQSIKKRAVSVGSPRQFGLGRFSGRILNNSSYTVVTAGARGREDSGLSLAIPRGTFSEERTQRFNWDPLSRDIANDSCYTMVSHHEEEPGISYPASKRPLLQGRPPQFDWGPLSGGMLNKSLYSTLSGGQCLMEYPGSSVAGPDRAMSKRGPSQFGCGAKSARNRPFYPGESAGSHELQFQSHPWYTEGSPGSHSMDDPKLSFKPPRQPLLQSPVTHFKPPLLQSPMPRFRQTRPQSEVFNSGGMTFRPSLNAPRALLRNPRPTQKPPRYPLLGPHPRSGAVKPPVRVHQPGPRPLIETLPQEPEWMESQSEMPRPNEISLGHPNHKQTPSFKMAVIQEGYPDQQFSDTQFTAFQMDLMSRIEEMPSGSGPQFKYCRLEAGAVVILCADSDSCQWLVQAVEEMLPWNGMTLLAVRANKLLKSVKFLVRLPAIFKKFSKEEVRKKIEVQNSGLKATQWAMFRERKFPDGTRTIMFSVPQQEALVLQNSGCKLFMGLTQIFGKILP